MREKHTLAAEPTPPLVEPRKRARRSSSVVAVASAPAGENAYEREREARIALNQERLAALNLPTLAKAIAAAAPAERQRGLSARRPRSEKEVLPPRKSLRSQGMAPDGTLAAGIQEERRDGSIVLVSGGVIAGMGEEPRLTRPVGTLAFQSLNGDAGSDAAFLGTLNGAVACSGTVSSTEALRRLKLSAEGVAKVTPKGITHLDFQPRGDTLLVAVADKEGSVGLFHVDAAGGAAEDAGEEDDGAADGVLLTRPHSQYVSGLRWAREGAPRLLSCSYDGSVRGLDPQAGSWLEVYVGGEGKGDACTEFSSFECSGDGRTLYIGDNEGDLRVVDARVGKAVVAPVNVHSKRVNTVSMERGGTLLATACGDSTVCLWDLRKGLGAQQPLKSLLHGKSCQSAYWAPNGARRLLTTSYDDTLSVWSDAGESIVRVKHDNNTGRWLLPLRAIWAPDGASFVCGSMKRETEVINAATGAALARHKDDLLTAVPSRHACHASSNAIAAGTASGRVHIWR